MPKGKGVHYTNIPHEEAWRGIGGHIRQASIKEPPMKFLLDLTGIILENKYFRFGDTFFYQICGVLMGSSFSPSLANLFMSDWENKIIFSVNQNPHI